MGLKVSANPAARLVFLIQPIKSFICGSRLPIQSLDIIYQLVQDVSHTPSTYSLTTSEGLPTTDSYPKDSKDISEKDNITFTVTSSSDSFVYGF